MEGLQENMGAECAALARFAQVCCERRTGATFKNFCHKAGGSEFSGEHGGKVHGARKVQRGCPKKAHGAEQAVLAS